MANKNSGSNSGGKAASSGKGRPTPKRNASNKKAQVQQSRNANRQWLILGAVLIAIIAAIIILGTVFGDPYEPIRNQQLEAIR